MIAVLLSVACSGGDDPTTGLPDLESPTSQPTWTISDMEAALAEALAEGFPEPWTVRDTYLDFFTHGDEICPGHDDYIEATWLYGCTAESGYWFSGVSEYVTMSGSVDLTTYDAWQVSGDLLFIDLEGQRFEGGGHIFANDKTIDSQPAFDAQILGTWIWEGHDGWLGGEGTSSVLDVLGRTNDGKAQLIFDGATSWSGFSLYFEDLVFTSECDHAVDGNLAIRDPSGAWHWMSYTDCSPCVDVAFGGFDSEVSGEACLDFTPLINDFMSRLDAP